MWETGIASRNPNRRPKFEIAGRNTQENAGGLRSLSAKRRQALTAGRNAVRLDHKDISICG